jgi:hypothetical protein
MPPFPNLAALALLITLTAIGVILDAVLIRVQRKRIEQLEAHVDLLQNAVAAAGTVFTAYVEMHLVKDTPEGRDKAARNKQMADVMHLALELTGLKRRAPKMRENVATPEGRELGAHLARFCDQEAIRQGKDGRCATCAFRGGGHVANGSPETLMSALKCVSERDPFWCHEENRPCAGYLLMRAAPEDARPMPWDHVEGTDS